MNRISQSFIDELLARTDIVEIVDARVTLRKLGSNYGALCPFHSEKTPSFTVSPTKQFFYCFGCSAHGNAIGFLMQFDRMEFIDALEFLAAKAGLSIPQESIPEKKSETDLYQLLDEVAKYYQQQLRHAPSAIAYLKSRGITGEIAKKFRLGYATDAWENLRAHLAKDEKKETALIQTGMLIKKNHSQIYDRFRARVTFPIRDNRGRVIGFGGRTLGDDLPKYLNSPETTIFHKGSELYGLYEARQANNKLQRIIIVEGYMDVIALAQFDITYAVATLGTATSSKHIQKLFRYTSQLIFCFDGDNAGRQAAWRAVEVALPLLHDGLEIALIFLPDGEDPDSFVRKHGQAGFLAQLQQAQPLSEFFFAHLSEEINLTHIDGKATLVAKVQQLLNKIPHGIFQQLMLEKLAAKINMQTEKLQTTLQVNPANTTVTFNPPLATQAAIRSPLKRAISLLLQNPNLAQTIQDFSFLQYIPGSQTKLLNEMLSILQKNPHLNAGALLTYWEDPKISQYLAKLAVYEYPLNPAAMQEEFTATFKQLAATQQKTEIQILLAKAKQTALTSDEKQRLQNLLTQRN